MQIFLYFFAFFCIFFDFLVFLNIKCCILRKKNGRTSQLNRSRFCLTLLTLTPRYESRCKGTTFFSYRQILRGNF